jgi:hypothetical protein
VNNQNTSEMNIKLKNYVLIFMNSYQIFSDIIVTLIRKDFIFTDMCPAAQNEIIRRDEMN